MQAALSTLCLSLRFFQEPVEIKLKPKGWLEFQMKDKGMFGFESGPVAAPWHILSTCRPGLPTWTLTQPLLE